MSADAAIGLLVSMGLLVYLVYALLWPGRF